MSAEAGVEEVSTELKGVVEAYLSGSRLRSFWEDLRRRDEGWTESEELAAPVGRAEAAVARLPSEAAREAAVKHWILAVPKGRQGREREEAHLLIRAALQRLRETGLVSLKLMCESLVNACDCGALPDAAGDSFRLLRRLLPRLDYKGVRDILKQLLDRLSAIPFPLSPHQRRILHSAQDLVLEIVQRKNNYLPAYFVMNELIKLSQMPNHRAFTLWRLAEAFDEIFESFRPLASIVSVTGRWMLSPVATHRGLSASTSWKLDAQTFRFSVKGSLPYNAETLAPQTFLIYTLLRQPRGKELLTHVFGREARERRGGAGPLSELVGQLLVEEMAGEESSDAAVPSPYRWLYLANIFVQSILTQSAASFTAILRHLIRSLTELPYRKARDELTWVVLQYVSGIGKNMSAEDGELVLELYRLLYTGEEEVLISNSDSSCVKKMAPTCLWIHLKAQGNAAAVPPSIQNQMDFLQTRFEAKESLKEESPLLAVICNAYSSDSEKEKMAMGVVMEQTEPLPLAFLDSLTLHAKIVLATHMRQLLEPGRSSAALCPASLESYARLISTTAELDAAKGLVMQILPRVVNSADLPLLHVLVELICFRLPPCYLPNVFKAHAAVYMRQALHTQAVASHPQLYALLETALLRQILFCQSSDYLQYLHRILGREQEPAFPEHLCRLLLFCLARTLVTSNAPGENLANSLQPYLNRLGIKTWAGSGLALFPALLRPHLTAYVSSRPAAGAGGALGGAGLGDGGAARASPNAALDQLLQNEYVYWRSLADDNSLVEHFMRAEAPPVFLCLMHKIVMENNQKIPHVAYRVLQLFSPAVFQSNMQRLVEHLIRCCILNQGHQTHLNNMIETLDKLIWTWELFGVEQLVGTVVLGEGDEVEAQAGLWILHWLLSRSPAFKARVSFLLSHAPNGISFASDAALKTASEFAKAFPSRSWAEAAAPTSKHPSIPLPHQPPLPQFLGHLGLNFLPVADLLIQRVLELPEHTKGLLEELLEHVAPLYRFHPQPTHFLSTTLLYYQSTLAAYPLRRRHLVLRMEQALEGCRPPGWLLSERFRRELPLDAAETKTFPLSDDYLSEMLERLEEGQMEALEPPRWAEADWRFAEFPSPAAQALHSSVVELLALPVERDALAAALIKHLLDLHLCQTPQKRPFLRVLNNTALLLSALPAGYHEALYAVLGETLGREWEMEAWEAGSWAEEAELGTGKRAGRLLALAHAFHHHLSHAAVNRLPGFFRDTLLPLIRSEAQFFFAVRLVLPFLQRIHHEKQDAVMKLGVDIYKALVAVDEASPGRELKEDLVSDLLYHLKYMFVGDGIKGDVDSIMERLRPSLREKLKFIAPPATQDAVTSASAAAPQPQGPPASTSGSAPST